MLRHNFARRSWPVSVLSSVSRRATARTIVRPAMSPIPESRVKHMAHFVSDSCRCSIPSVWAYVSETGLTAMCHWHFFYVYGGRDPDVSESRRSHLNRSGPGRNRWRHCRLSGSRRIDAWHRRVLQDALCTSLHEKTQWRTRRLSLTTARTWRFFSICSVCPIGEGQFEQGRAECPGKNGESFFADYRGKG
jgi:hypothetical protein